VAVNPRVFKDAFVSVNGTNISAYCSAATVESTFEELDSTTFGGNYRQFTQGLGDATITLTTFPDTTGTVNSIFWPLSQSGGTFALIVRESSAAASTSNYNYSMSASLFGFNPIGGAVGDLMSTDIPCRNAGTAGLTRGTT
jgi:hypothetical protein